MKNKNKTNKKTEKPSNAHTSKLAYHRMFQLVSRKTWRQPFCLDDKWVQLTGHFSFLLFYSLFSFHPFLLPSFLHSFLLPLSPLTNQKPQFVPPDCGPGDGFHQVTDLSASARGKTPQTLGNSRRPTAGEMRSVIYICWGSSKGQLTYISTTGDSVCMSQKIALTSHIQLESQNFLIP